MKKFSHIVLPCIVAVFLMMCSNPSEPEENIPLSKSESEELIRGVLHVVTDTMLQITATLSPERFTIACPEGGEVNVRFNNDIDDTVSGDTLRTANHINFVPRKCGITGNEGTKFILDGNDDGIDYNTTITVIGFFDDIDVSSELEGESSWTVGERSGTCTIDLDMQVDVTVSDDLTGETDSVLVTGSACEHELSFNAVLPIAPEI